MASWASLTIAEAIQNGHSILADTYIKFISLCTHERSSILPHTSIWMDLLEYFVDVGGPGFLLRLDSLLGVTVNRGGSLARRSRRLLDLGLDILSFSCVHRGARSRESLAGQRWHSSRFGKGLSRSFSRHDVSRDICRRCVVRIRRTRSR